MVKELPERKTFIVKLPYELGTPLAEEARKRFVPFSAYVRSLLASQVKFQQRSDAQKKAKTKKGKPAENVKPAE